MKHIRDDHVRCTLTEDMIRLFSMDCTVRTKCDRIEIVFNLILVDRGLRPGYLNATDESIDFRLFLTIHRLHALGALYDGLSANILDENARYPATLFQRAYSPAPDPATHSIPQWLGQQLGYLCPRAELLPSPVMSFTLIILYQGMTVRLFSFNCKGVDFKLNRFKLNELGTKMQRVLNMELHITCRISVRVGIPARVIPIEIHEAALIEDGWVTGPDGYLEFLLLYLEPRLPSHLELCVSP